MSSATVAPSPLTSRAPTVNFRNSGGTRTSTAGDFSDTTTSAETTSPGPSSPRFARGQVHPLLPGVVIITNAVGALDNYAERGVSSRYVRSDKEQRPWR